MTWKKMIMSGIFIAANSLNQQTIASTNKPLYLLLGAGASFSQRSHISVNPQQWDPAIQGYNSTLHDAPVYSAGIGYELNPCISINIEADRRSTYRYNKLQTPPASTIQTLGFLGVKTRKFDLANTSLMTNIFLNGSGLNLLINPNPCTVIQPFVGAGMGVAYNTVSNFHSVLSTVADPTSVYVSSIMNPHTHAAFAWQAFLGLEALYKKCWAFDLAYRYFDGGKYKSNNYFINTPAGLTQPITVAHWKGKLTANEVFFSIKYFI